ncbi:MAG: BON domain-containing protein [Gemmatimonadaceae bacterium]
MNMIRGRLGMLAGVGLGAALMYFMDAGRGGRRRALVRDKSAKATRKTSESLQGRAEDVRNRAKGKAAEARAQLNDKEPTNHQLEARIRARLGHSVDNPRSIKVVADGGNVTLRGVALRDELDDVFETVRGVNGVKEVRSELQIEDTPGDIASLQD